MTASGKTLQEIYNSSTTRLAEVESAVAAKLKKTGAAKVEQRKTGDDNAQGKIEEKSKQLHAELQASRDESVIRLKKTIETEVKDTQEHLAQLTSDLENLAERMRKQIASLRTAHENGLTSLRQNLSDQFEGLIENSKINLGQEEFIATKKLRNHGTSAMNSLQQKLDHSLWESRGEEKQYNTQLFKSFMQKANSIDTRFQSLMQKLAEEFQTQFKSLESRAQQSESQLSAETQGLLDQIEEQASLTEGQIQEFYNQENAEHTQRLDRQLNLVAQDLSQMHDAITGQLNSRTKELSKSLMNASGEVRDSLTRRVGDLNDKVDSMMAHFNARLEERVSESQELKGSLEEEKAQIFGGLKNELADIRKSFEKRLTKLMKDGIDRVKTCEQDATTDIESNHRKCMTDLNAASSNARKEVEDAVVNFLTMIHEHKENALKQIAQAAGDTSGGVGDK
jgi:hypothetical protein